MNLNERNMLHKDKDHDLFLTYLSPQSKKRIIAEKMKIALAPYKGSLRGSGEIIFIVHSMFPEIPLSCIMPWDVCNNLKNKDPKSGKYPLLHYEGQGLGGKFLYRVL